MMRFLFPACLAFGLLVHGSSLGAGGAVKIVNLDKVNTAADEDDPFVTSNSLMLLYASNKNGSYDIWLSKRTGAGLPFPAGKPFLVSQEDDERSPFVLPAQVFNLYYAVNHVPDEKLKDLRNFDIVRRSGEMAPLPLLQISEREDEMHPWLTTAAKEFYFSRKLKEGWALFVASGPVPGPPKEVGLPPGFCRASLNVTGLTMYLQGPLDDERTGIFRSKRARVGAPWSKPAHLQALDHPEAKRGALSPCVRGDRLYFASDRPGGKGGMDLYWVEASKLK